MKMKEIAHKLMGSDSSKKIFEKNTKQSNIFISKMMLVFAVAVVANTVVSLILNGDLIYSNDVRAIFIYDAITILLLVVSALTALVKKGEGAYLPYVLMLSLTISAYLVNQRMVSGASIVFIFPIIICCRYFLPRLTFISSLLSLISLVISIGETVMYNIEQFGNEEGIDVFIKNLVISYLPTFVSIIVCGLACVIISKKCRMMVVEQDEISTKNAAVQTELSLASDIQMNMLPNTFPAFPNRKEFEIFANMIPAKEVGGDFYDFYLKDDDHLVMTIADVSDKGVPAALFMSMSRTVLKLNTKNYNSPVEIIKATNNQLCAENKNEMFVTVWFAIYEISTGKLRCVNAGHEYPVICRKDGNFELYKDKHSFVLGGMENMKFTEYELDLCEGDTLFVYTDGVVEAENESGEDFTEKRMVDTLNRYKDCNEQLLVENMKKSVLDFTGNADRFDDITMMAFKVNFVPNNK